MINKNKAAKTSCQLVIYYPFGMLMPGRHYNADKYRFGFNGKEHDTEWKGSAGAIYDYGFRIYDPRVAKFLSVDPLTKKYPELTPYQFASNRPIDGIDLDGAEWVTYEIWMDGPEDQKPTVIITDHRKLMSVSRIQQVHKMSVEEFYKKYSQAFEEKGRGILYKYNIYNNKTGEYEYSEEWFDKEGLGSHGLYYGAGCVTKLGPKFKENVGVNKYDYSQEPLDEVDFFAKLHDKAYDFPGYGEGYLVAWLNDYRTLDADYLLLEQALDYLEKAKDENYIDKVTKRKPSEEAIQKANDIRIYFGNVIIPRKERLKKIDEAKKESQRRRKKAYKKYWKNKDVY